eukprot:1408569-Prymnesium_polylepis.1
MYRLSSGNLFCDLDDSGHAPPDTLVPHGSLLNVHIHDHNGRQSNDRKAPLQQDYPPWSGDK